MNCARRLFTHSLHPMTTLQQCAIPTSSTAFLGVGLFTSFATTLIQPCLLHLEAIQTLQTGKHSYNLAQIQCHKLDEKTI